MDRALCARLKSVIAVLAPRARYFLVATRKYPKKRSPGWREYLPALLAGPGRAPQLAGRKQRAPGSNTGCAKTPGPAARFGRAIRGGKEHPCQGLRWLAHHPVGASRAPSKAGGIRETFDRARGAYFAPGELGERPAVARRAGHRAYSARRSDRGGFLLVTFLCPSKEKSPAVGQPPTSMRRRRRHKT